LSVGFNTASALVHELLEARDEKRLLRLQRQLAGYKLLIIDELGYVPLSQTGAELLFEVFSQRYERGSTLVTSNLPFDEWTSVFGSERLTGLRAATLGCARMIRPKAGHLFVSERMSEYDIDGDARRRSRGQLRHLMQPEALGLAGHDKPAPILRLIVIMCFVRLCRS
jgi:IstB-like ATP binding protein